MLVFIWLGVILVAVYLYLRQIYSRFDKYGVKYDKPLPILGNMGDTLFGRKHLVECLMEQYSKYSEERFFGRYDLIKPNLIIRDLELIKQIGVKDFEYFLDHGLSVCKDIDPIFSRVLFTMKGQEWKDMRSTLSPAFTSSKIRNMLPFIEEVGNQMLKTLRKQIKESGKGYVDLEVRDIASRYANDVIASCAFGLSIDSHTHPDNEFYREGHKAATFSFKQMLTFIGHSSFPFIMKSLGITLLSEQTRTFFTNLVMDTMKDREDRGIHRPDMIHLLMEAKKGKLTHEDKSYKDMDAGFATVEEHDVGKKTVNKVWSDVDLTAQAVLFFRAGFETVSSVMTFFLYEMARHPEIQDRLAQEIREHADKNDGKLEYNSLQALNYLDMVLSEVLRLWPPAIATDRLCIKDYNLGRPNAQATRDYIIRAGESLNFPLTAIHRDPRYFKDPLKFDPERFSEENKHKIKPNTYLPFGLGPRNCIGSRFALCEVKVMIYQLLLEMEVLPYEKTTIPPKLTTNTFNLRLKGGHHLRIKPRNKTELI